MSLRSNLIVDANPSHKDFECSQTVSVGDPEAIVLQDIAYREIR
jgi:hypothetical protein